MLPARGTSSRDDTLLGSRDFGSVQLRIDQTYDASLAYLDEHLSSPDPPGPTRRAAEMRH